MSYKVKTLTRIEQRHLWTQRWGQGSGPPPPPENLKPMGSLSNNGPEHPKITNYQASIPFLAIIGPPEKRHLMAFRWRADVKWRFASGPTMVHF